MSMLDLFTPASDDRSLQYLYRLFGDMNGLLGGGQSVAFSLFGELFRTFNTIALSIGTLIVVYTTIVGVLKTAAEGEFLGRQWNSLWIPLRMVLGIAALVPTPSGYSGLQIVMMWVIMQGVGAADQVWSTALRYVSVIGSPYTQSVQIPTMGVKINMQNVFAMLACDQSMNQNNIPAFWKITKDDVSYDYGQGTKPFSYSVIQKGTSPYQSGTYATYSTACGSFTIEQGGPCAVAEGENYQNPAQMMPILQCRVANAQVVAMNSIVKELSRLAQNVVLIDRVYQSFYSFVSKASTFPPFKKAAMQVYNANQYLQTSCQNLINQGRLTKGPDQSMSDLCTSNAVLDALGKPASVAFIFQESAQDSVTNVYYPALIALGAKGDFIQTVTDEYGTAVAKPVNDYLTYLSGLIQNRSTTLNAAFQSAENTGWIFAGAYYYMLSQSNNASFSTAANVKFDATLKNANDSAFKGKYTNIDTANFLAGAATSQQESGAASAFGSAGGPGGTAGQQAVTGISSTTSYVNGSWNTMLQQKQTDPLVALQAFGYVLLFLVPILWLLVLIVFVSISVVASLSPTVLGTGFGPIGTGPYWTAFLYIAPILFTLLTLLIGVGGLIGIYTPFVPYVIFITGALGWLISIVETMVAGPLVALGILAPGGHHDVLGKAEPALMLLFGNFLRPTLMIFGMFAAMLLAPIALDLLNGTFSMVITSIAAMGATTQNTASGSGGATYSQGGAAALYFNPVAMLLFLCVYVMLIITLLNKCFAAIHIIPERVMGWIGGQGAQYGEAEALGEAKKGVEGGAHGVTQGMGGVKEAAPGVAKTKAESDKAKEEAKKKGGSGLET